MKRTWLGIVIISALVILGIVIHLARPRSDETGPTTPHEAPVSSTPAPDAGSTAPSTLAACIGPRDPRISDASLVAKHKWAHSLFLKGHLDSAVTELRNIATADPGYPAINFEISDALLKSSHATEARDAIKLQLEISECLANLAPADMQTYCKSEADSLPSTGCSQELAKIGQQAHYEAGLIDAASGATAELHPPLPAKPAFQPRHVPEGPAVDPPPPITAANQPHAPETTSPEPAAPKLVSTPRIPSAEASEHIGERATVCGNIVSRNTAEQSNGKPTFINLDRSFPDKSFTVVIWGADSPAVGDFPTTGRVCVTGTIASYRGSPQIVVRDPQSWSRAGER